MDLDEAKNILRSFVRYYRFDEKKTFTEQELSQAIEYFAFNDLVPKKKIEDIIEEINIDIEINRERKINNEKYANLSMKSIFYEPEIVKARLLRLLEDK